MHFIKGISLFANVGIAETYLHECGIDIVVANELIPDRCRRYQELYPSCQVICGDITDDDIYQNIVNQARTQGVDFLIATPPCQGMSIAGKMQPDDPRNTLITKAVDAIVDIGVSHRLIENVPGSLKTYLAIDGNQILIPEYIQKRLSQNYHITFQVLDTADYNTPQHRKRAIILGSRIASWYPPSPFPHISVHEAIGHLPSLEASQSSHIIGHTAKAHNPDHIRWMRHTPTGQTAFDNPIHFPSKSGRKIKGFRTTYKRMHWDKPAPTITMKNGSISSQNNVHPGRLLPNGTYSDARVLTVAELSILTGLPQHWTPPPRASDVLIRQAIGEGIPPKLIQQLIQTMPH